jgi:hypothetical protein
VRRGTGLAHATHALGERQASDVLAEWRYPDHVGVAGIDMSHRLVDMQQYLRRKMLTNALQTATLRQDPVDSPLMQGVAVVSTVAQIDQWCD